MGIIALVRADFLNQRHTSYWGIHTVIPIAGAILFVFYFLLYQNVDELKRIFRKKVPTRLAALDRFLSSILFSMELIPVPD